MTAPTTTPEYTRRVIAPTATAEPFAADLVAVLEQIRATYTPLVAESTNAVIEGHGFEVAEQVIADLEHIHDVTHAWIKAHNLTEYRCGDGLGDLLLGIVPTGELHDALNEHSPERIADNRARERWMCAKYGIDPDNIDGNMSVSELHDRCQGDKEAMTSIVEQHQRGRQS